MITGGSIRPQTVEDPICASASREVFDAQLACNRAISRQDKDIPIDYLSKEVPRVVAIGARLELFAPSSVINRYNRIGVILGVLNLLVMENQRVSSAIAAGGYQVKEDDELAIMHARIHLNFEIWHSRLFLCLEKTKIEMRRDLSVYWRFFERDSPLMIDRIMADSADRPSVPMPWLPQFEETEALYRRMNPMDHRMPVPKSS